MPQRRNNPDWQDSIVRLAAAIVGGLLARLFTQKLSPRKRPNSKKRAGKKKAIK